MVRPHLQLKAVFRFVFRARHYPGIGDEDVQCLGLGEESLSTCSHTLQRIEFEFDYMHSI